MARWFIFLIIALGTLTSCSSVVEIAESNVSRNEWKKAIKIYEEALQEDPEDIEIRLRLQRIKLIASDYFYQRGLEAYEQKQYDRAIHEYKTGLDIRPKNDKILQAMRITTESKEAEETFREAIRHINAGRKEQGKSLLERTLVLKPDHKMADIALGRLVARQKEQTAGKLALTSTAPISLNFKSTKLKIAFEFIARSFGINTIFDDEVKDASVTLFAKDVTFEQGLNLLLASTKTFYKKVGPNTILIIPDVPSKRTQFDDHIVRTFQLNTIPATEMLKILKGVFKLKKVMTNDDLNTLIIRDSAPILKLVEKLIVLNDRRPAEIVIDVEILEVNRTKTEQLGFDYGYSVSEEFSSFNPSEQSFASALANNGTVTIPAITFRFYKQDVDATTLANPKIRVISGEEAKIHIGDRVPLRASTIQDSTGQTRTTYNYTDIGIRLNVKPMIHLDNSVTIQLGLEVSSLGQNLGDADEPAYSIGTRNADTSMLLRDGETAILGGLIRDEERKNRVKVPGFGDIPIIGWLFTSVDDSEQRTDVLLTMTPRVVRPWDLPEAKNLQFFSGTEEKYSDKAVFSFLNQKKKEAGLPEIEFSDMLKSVDEKKENKKSYRGKKSLAQLPTLLFSESVYEVEEDDTLNIQIDSKNMNENSQLEMEIMFNANVAQYKDSKVVLDGIKSFSVDADNEKGLLKIKMQLPERMDQTEVQSLAKIKMEGVAEGTSYLIYKTSSLSNSSGKRDAQVKSSKIVVK